MARNKHCTNCDIRIDINDKFCWNCGDSVLMIENFIHWLDSEFKGYDKFPRARVDLFWLTSLDLSNNDITELPKDIGLLNKLIEVNLSMNNLKEIPKEFSLLTNLKKLDVSFNNLDKVPTTIFQLSKLTSLDLSHINITELPKQIGLLTNLTSLNLSKNNITELPKEVGLLTKLRKLYLGGNQLTSLPKEIDSLVDLEEINLLDNNFEEIPKEIGFFSRLNISNIDQAHTKIYRSNQFISVIRLKKMSELEKQELIEEVNDMANQYAKGGSDSVGKKSADLIKKILADGWYAEVPVNSSLGAQNSYWQYDIYLWAAARYLKGITPNTEGALTPDSDYNKEFKVEIRKLNNINGLQSFSYENFKYEALFKDGERVKEWSAWNENGQVKLKNPVDRHLDKRFRLEFVRQIHERLALKTELNILKDSKHLEDDWIDF